jgi:3-hydroxybutyrate dehydrogenase
LENAGSGITANCINPGWVRTILVERQIEAKAKLHNISIEKATEMLLEEKQPSKQFVQVGDLAAAVLFLCGDHASQMTGTCMVMDGGKNCLVLFSLVRLDCSITDVKVVSKNTRMHLTLFNI